MAAEVAAHGSLADIQVDDDYLFVGISQAQGQVSRDEGLTRTFVERGKGDNLHRLSFFGHKCHVGAQDAEGFRGDVCALFVDRGGSHFGRLLVERNLTQQRHVGVVFNILSSVHPRVKEEDAQERHSRHCQSDQDTQQQNAVAVGADGSLAAVGTVDDAGIVVGHGLCQCILFAAVEQEQIERFLNLLLAFDRKHFPLFGRYGFHPFLCMLFTALGVVALHVDAHNEVVHCADDGLLHGAQRVVQLLHHRVAVAAVGNQLVAAQLHLVILIDLRLDVDVADARVRRYQVYFLCRIGEVVFDVLSQTELGFQFHHTGAVFLRVVEIHGCR